jgi:two-component system response regulator FixJ
MNNVSVSLIDADLTRRVSFVHALSKCGVHVEPFEDIDEFSARTRGREVVLVHHRDREAQGVLRWAATSKSPVGVLAYSEDPQIRTAVDALKAGAFDFVEWPGKPDLIQKAITSCIDGKLAEWDRAERQLAARKLIESLTPRERQVLLEMVEGHSSRVIGERLGISRRTVEIHRAHMLTKLRASNSVEAVRIAYEADLDH